MTESYSSIIHPTPSSPEKNISHHYKRRMVSCLLCPTLVTAGKNNTGLCRACFLSKEHARTAALEVCPNCQGRKLRTSKICESCRRLLPVKQCLRNGCEEKNWAKGLCKRHYHWYCVTGSLSGIPHKARGPAEERFW